MLMPALAPAGRPAGLGEWMRTPHGLEGDYLGFDTAGCGSVGVER
jgi:hypothetical protein